MTLNERLDVLKDGFLCHEGDILRAISRTSMEFACNSTILRALTRTPIRFGMEPLPDIDVDALAAAMTAFIENPANKMSARKFSLAVTKKANPDFYRNFINDGRNKRVSADVFIRAAYAVGKTPQDFLNGAPSGVALPSASVLMSTFAVLLESLGIDPIEGGRAQRLASSFPNALQRSLALQAQLRDDEGSPPEAGAPDPDEDRPAA